MINNKFNNMSDAHSLPSKRLFLYGGCSSMMDSIWGEEENKEEEEDEEEKKDEEKGKEEEDDKENEDEEDKEDEE